MRDPQGGTLANKGVPAPPGGRDSLIFESHERSRRWGHAESSVPDYTSVPRGTLEMEMERSRSLLLHATPVMETLYQQIVNTHNMVILTDAKGLILHTCGDDDFLLRADKVALRKGVDWSERSKGTNAIGTALVAGEPTVVHADEHFLHANHFLTCSCAPVRDPFGNVVGALDISGEHHSFHKHTLALVRMSAQMVENHFFEDTFPEAICVHFHARPEFLGTLVEGIAAFTPAGKFLSANASGQFQLGLPQSALHAHTFASLFGISVSTLIDQQRRATGVMSCCLHNGVAVYLRAKHNLAPTGVALAPRPAAPAVEPASKDAARPTGPSSLHYLNTGDPAVARVLGLVGKVIDKDISVLVLGETGTGKELLARAIHNDSPRRHGPFVAINCASIPEGLIESELFGYVEGAFTGGRKRGHSGKILAANGGTLFLDEIGDMPFALQPRLLRVLEERRVVPLGSETSVSVDVALVCATHRDLRRMIDEKQFREDLYYRINGLVVRLPRLRDRTDLETIIHRLLLREGASEVTLAPDVMRFFERYAWPGNVRQLANVLRTARQMVDADGVIRREHLPDDMLLELEAADAVPAPAPPRAAAAEPLPASVPCAAPPPAAPAANAAAIPARLDDLEWRAIQDALDRNGGNVSAAARALGVSRNTIYRRLERQGRPQ